MSNIAACLRNPAARPQGRDTLWRCENCNSFIAIHSEMMVDEALCPACTNVLLKYYGPCDGVFLHPFADA
jgi:hypothetical protein